MFGMWVAEWGQPPDSFWTSDVVEFMAIYDAWVQRFNRSFLQTGTIVAALYNVNRGRTQKAFTPEDIFPHLRALRPARRARTVAEKNELSARIVRYFRGREAKPVGEVSGGGAD